jgi:hypothetical protein
MNKVQQKKKLVKSMSFISFRCFSLVRENAMLARLTRTLFSAGRFQNVLNQPLKWYAFK